MALWNRAAQVVERADAIASNVRALPTSSAAFTIPTWGQHSSTTNADWAMRIPAFYRGVKLITGSCAGLPLVQWRGRDTVPGNQLLAQPEADRVYWVSMQRHYRDLLLYGKAYWLVRDVNGEGYPTKVRILPATEVSEDSLSPDTVRWNNATFLKSHPAGPGTQMDSVICFDSFEGGVLARGIDILEGAAELEGAVKRYAEAPLPSSVLVNSGADLPDDQVEALLTQWESSRAKRGTAYLNSALTLQTLGWSASELQMTDARNESAIQIARLLGLDPMWVGASVGGSSLTYSSRLDMRKDLIDLTLTDYLAPTEQRLGARDCTPNGNLVQADTTEFLRGSLPERANLATQLLAAGVIDESEARHFLNFAPGERPPLS